MSSDTHDLLFAQRAHHQVLWYRKTSWNVHRHQGGSWPYTQENCPTSCPRWLPVDGSAGTTLKLGTTLPFPVWLLYPGKHSNYHSSRPTALCAPRPGPTLHHQRCPEHSQLTAEWQLSWFRWNLTWARQALWRKQRQVNTVSRTKRKIVMTATTTEESPF